MFPTTVVQRIVCTVYCVDVYVYIVHYVAYVTCGVCGKIRKDCDHLCLFLVCGSLLCVTLFCLEVVKILL